MRHYKKGRKLGTDKSHTKAMKRNLVCALFLNDRIKTIESRAKEIRGDVDKIIGWAKRGDLHSRRLAIAALGGDKYLVAEIFEKVKQGMFKERNSGYTRIVKLGARKGDNAPMVIMELINEGKKKQEPKPDAKKSGRKKTAPKKSESVKNEQKTSKKEDAPKDEKPAEKQTVPKEENADSKPENIKGDEEKSAPKDEKPAEKKEVSKDQKEEK